MVAALLAGRRDPAGLRSRRRARRLCVGLARRQDRPAHGVHLVRDHDLARDRCHGLHRATGLSPLVLVFMIRYWVPESPRWLLRMGRVEEARKSLAWALMIDPKEIELPATVPTPEQTRWLELFKYPRLVAAGCLTGMTQTGGAPH